MNVPQRRLRDRWVSCWCRRCCTNDTGAPRQVVARTRDEHLAADQASIEHNQSRGLDVSVALTRAVQMNRVAVANDDSDGTDSDSSSSDSSADAGARSHQLASNGGSVGSDRADGTDLYIGALHSERIQDVQFINAESNSDTASEDEEGFHPERPRDSSEDEDGHGAGDSFVERWLEDEEDQDQRGDDTGLTSSASSSASIDSVAGIGIVLSLGEEQTHDDRGTCSRFGQDLFDALAGDYRPGRKPSGPPYSSSALRALEDLTPSEQATLRHFRTCNQNEATQKMYVEFAKNVQEANPEVKISSKERAIQLVKRVTQLKEMRWDMCVNSCKAFVGPDRDSTECDICAESRFDRLGKPRKQYITIPYLPRVRAMFSSGTAPTYLAERTARAQETFFESDHRFQDWVDGQLHFQLVQEGLFTDPRHEALMLSADGTKLIENRDANAWIVLLTSLNSPPQQRFRREETFVSTIIPGPKNPVDMEDSFLWPVLEELARAARGFWVWDGGKREWFLWKAWLVAACADQPGSSKLSKMTGTTGGAACRICRVRANYPPKEKRQIGGYYPMKTVGANLNARNLPRPHKYHVNDVLETLLRDDDTYEIDLAQLHDCLTQHQLKNVQRDSGVTGRPLLAFSPAFSHPFFFPPDMFHLFGINLPQLLWDVLRSTTAGGAFTLTDHQQELFGDLVENAGLDLPSTFSSAPPRNPYKHSHSYYKMHEWSSITYYYLLPFLFSIGAPVKVVAMLGHLVAGVRLAVSDTGSSLDQVLLMQQQFNTFVEMWEDLFIQDDVELLSRATISVHYLLHVPQCTLNYGSMRVTSQARCEREIGMAKRTMRSYKSPFANVANNAVRREHLRLLNLVLRDQDASEAEQDHDVVKHVLKVRLRKLRSSHSAISSNHSEQERLLVRSLSDEGVIPDPPPPIIYRGKVQLPRGDSIRGLRTESSSARKACHFAYRDQTAEVQHAKVIHFFCFDDGSVDPSKAAIETDDAYALCHPLSETQSAHGIIRGNWSDRLMLVPVTAIVELVGTFHLGGYVYILRKLSCLGDE